MKLTIKQLKQIIKEEVTAHSTRNPSSLMWIGKDDQITDECPMCGGDEAEHTASGCDYEQCGHCGFDHSYEPEQARNWHEENDPEGDLYA